MMRRWLLVLGLGCGWTLTALAQPLSSDTTAVDYGTGGGLQVLLNNYGFSLGLYYQRSLSHTWSLQAEATLGSIKDEREQRFFRSQFGGSIILNKANYVVVLPLHLGLQRRLFADAIEDNFRPFVQLSGGGLLAWQYPYFRDDNGNGAYDQDERIYDAFTSIPRGTARLGMSGMLTIGAHFGSSKSVTQSVRIGYAFVYVPEGLQLLEPSVRGPETFTSTPTLTILFGRLF